MKFNYYSLSAIAHKTLKGDLGYTSGVFDLFHQGHKLYLEKCKTLCDTLIIGVDDDSLVKTNKVRIVLSKPLKSELQMS